VQLYKEYHDQGLEVIGLMYEHFRDFSRAARQVRRFREKFGIRYPLLIAGYSDKEAASRTLPMLNHVLSYPTTIFVDRRGRVRKIHTGFTGPGTGEHYRQLTREYRELVEQLLRE
ncbi:MAG: TlpA family protein disulfide reductase, partial [Calditrichaeota bacterium]